MVDKKDKEEDVEMTVEKPVAKPSLESQLTSSRSQSDFFKQLMMTRAKAKSSRPTSTTPPPKIQSP